jgi:plastocyanin
MRLHAHSPDAKRTWLGAAALVLVLTACGGGGASVPTEPGAPGTPPPPPPTPPGTQAPSTAMVTTPDRNFSPHTVTIRAGGTVTWVLSERDHQVTFSGPTPPEGDIPRTDEGAAVSRTFPEPGIYPYICERHIGHGMSGVVVVVADDGEEPPPQGPPAATASVSTPGSSFSPATARIAAGGSVTWNISGARHNVAFTAAAPPGGSIPDTDPGNAVSRTFPDPGSYPYLCTRHSGMTGTVVVEETP